MQPAFAGGRAGRGGKASAAGAKQWQRRRRQRTSLLDILPRRLSTWRRISMAERRRSGFAWTAAVRQIELEDPEVPNSVAVD